MKESEFGMTGLPSFLTHPNPEKLYRNGNYLVVDFETDTLDKGSALNENNDIVLACWQIVIDGEVVSTKECWGGIYEQQELLDDIARVDFIVAQNLKFELQWLKRCGLELRDVLGYDTMLAEWVLDGNKKTPRNLSALAKRYKVPGKLDIVAQFIAAGVATRDINPRWLLEYCHQDVESTRRIFLEQQKEVSQREVWHLVHVRNMCCSCLADMEFEGMTLDPEKVNEEYMKAHKILEETGAKLAELTKGVNLGSPKQLATYLYDVLGFKEAVDYKGKPIRTGKGQPSTNAKTLALLKPSTPQQEEFLQLYKNYNKQASLIEKNLDYFKLTCEQRDCNFQGELKQNVVQTHRLASSGIPILFEGLKKPKSVQLQNIPREYKKLFWSGDPDWLIAEPDGSQLEFRVAVDLGNDTIGLEEIENGTDIHSYTAQVLLDNKDPELVNADPKDRRQLSKPHTFRPLYGGASGSPALVAYCEYFKDKYKGVSETQRSWALKCVDKKQFTTPYGMTFYFPTTTMNKRGYIKNTTSIYNYPVQGFATGEIIPIALIYFWHRTRDMRVRIFSTIHDSIAAKVHKDEVDLLKKVAKQCLTYDVYEFLERVYHYKFHVPLGLGFKVGTHWGTGKEEKWDVWPDGREVERT
jgi:DNA polymerase I-like protein with 3'-5' exonuclease and polymerase domains